ncbi:MAG: NADPH-dependent stearoyl-CoA 9-desaturase, partial [Acidimicrobiaceae bacterium]
DIPAKRYQQIAPQVQAVCERYGLPYNTGSFSKQLGSVFSKIVRLALPTRRTAAPQPRPRPASVGAGLTAAA